MNIPAQILGVLGILSNILGIQFKSKKNILIAFMLANVLFSVTFFLLKGYSGAIICIVAAVQTFIKHTYDKKEVRFPKYLVAIFMIVSLLCGFLTYRSLIDILPIICSILYTLSIIQNKERNLRLITLVNIIFWTIYDIKVGAYTAGINDVLLALSTIVAIFRYDIFHKKTNLVDKLDNFTINCNKGFMVSDIINLNKCKLVYSSTIEDSYWNFLTGINANSKEEFNKVWQDNRKHMIERNRTPALYITPSSNMINKYKDILPEYLSIESHEVWMVMEDFSNIDSIKDSNIDLRIDNNPTLNIFADVFMKAYGESSDEDPYGKMPECYREAIINSKNSVTKYKRYYYVAYYNDNPIATALTIEKDRIALIGFVGTIPEYRNKGVCKQLMKQVLIDLRKRKIKTAYLQTEEGYIPEKLYSNIGFKKIGNAVIAVEK